MFALFKYLHSWAGTFFLITRLLRLLMPLQVSLFVLLVCINSVCHQALFSMQYLRTTYVGQVMARELNKEPNAEVATRMGNLAMLIYSVGRSS